MSSRSSKVISLSLAKGLLMVVNLASGMVLARVLSKSDYGTYLQTFLAYDFALPILTMGLPQALYYFLPSEKSKKKKLVLENILLLFGAGIIFSLFIFFGGNEILAQRFNNPNLVKTLKWMTLFPLYTFPLLAGSAVWVIQDKVKVNAIFNVVIGLIVIVSVIIASLLTKTYVAPTIARIVVPIIFLPIGVYLMFKYVPGDWYKPSMSSIWQMAKFSIPLGLATVFGTLTRQLANVIVSMLTTPVDFAIYSNGAREVPLIGMITGSIGLVILADMTRYIKEGDSVKALSLFRKSSTLSALFLLPIMVFLMVFAESFINILYSNKYELSVLPFRIYLFMLPVRIVYYGSAFIALGKTKAILYRSIISLILTAFFAYLFTMWMGYVGAAIATVAVSYIWAIPYNLITLSKSFACSKFYVVPLKKIGKILVFSIISIFPSGIILIVNVNSLLTFIIGITLFGVTYFFMAHRYIPEFNEVMAPFKIKILKLLKIVL